MNFNAKNVFIVVLVSVLMGFMAVGVVTADPNKTAALRTHPSAVRRGESFTVMVENIDDYYGAAAEVIENVPEGFEFLGAVDNNAKVTWVAENNQVEYYTFTDDDFGYRLQAPEQSGEYTFIGSLENLEKVPFTVKSTTVTVGAFTVLENTYDVNPKTLLENENVTATVDVRNNTAENRAYSLSLFMDGRLVENETSRIQANSIKEFSFTISVKKAGIHEVAIDELPSRKIVVRVPVDLYADQDRKKFVSPGENFLVRLSGLTDYYDNFAEVIENIPENFEFLGAVDNSMPVIWDNENNQVIYTPVGDNDFGYWLEAPDKPVQGLTIEGWLNSDIEKKYAYLKPLTVSTQVPPVNYYKDFVPPKGNVSKTNVLQAIKAYFRDTKIPEIGRQLTKKDVVNVIRAYF